MVKRDTRRTRRVVTEFSGHALCRSEHALRVVELSARGCLVSTSQRMAPGTVLDLRIDLEDGPFIVKTRVADSAIDGSTLPDETPHYLVGLHFLDLRALDEQRLLRYLAASERAGSHTAQQNR